jgi:pyruvate/2-oxoglutarate/acetoin dehydrogenase E1 component
MAEECLAAARVLLERHAVAAEVLVYARLHPFDPAAALERVAEHGRIVVAEEGIRPFGWGSEVAACLSERAFDVLEAPVGRVGSRCEPIGAAARLEGGVLPAAADIVAAVLETRR